MTGLTPHPSHHHAAPRTPTRPVTTPATHCIGTCTPVSRAGPAHGHGRGSRQRAPRSPPPAPRPAPVDVDLAALDVTTVVHVMRHGTFRRYHLLAEARRHLALTLRGTPHPAGLGDRIADTALRDDSRPLHPASGPPEPVPGRVAGASRRRLRSHCGRHAGPTPTPTPIPIPIPIPIPTPIPTAAQSRPRPAVRRFTTRPAPPSWRSAPATTRPWPPPPSCPGRSSSRCRSPHPCEPPPPPPRSGRGSARARTARSRPRPRGRRSGRDRPALSLGAAPLDSRQTSRAVPGVSVGGVGMRWSPACGSRRLPDSRPDEHPRRRSADKGHRLARFLTERLSHVASFASFLQQVGAAAMARPRLCQSLRTMCGILRPRASPWQAHAA